MSARRGDGSRPRTGSLAAGATCTGPRGCVLSGEVLRRDEAGQTLDRLILATAQGDHDAFHTLYIQSRAQLFGVILRIVRRGDRAEDVLQEVYLRIWSHASDYRPEKGAPMAWMTVIARNRALDWARRRTDVLSVAQDDGLDGLPDPDSMQLHWSDAGSDARALRDCLAELPKEQRDCILLAHVQGYTHDEISAALATPLGTVKSWIRRGLSRMKTCLDR